MHDEKLFTISYIDTTTHIHTHTSWAGALDLTRWATSAIVLHCFVASCRKKKCKKVTIHYRRILNAIYTKHGWPYKYITCRVYFRHYKHSTAITLVHLCMSLPWVCWKRPIFWASRWWRRPALAACHSQICSIFTLSFRLTSSARLYSHTSAWCKNREKEGNTAMYHVPQISLVQGQRERERERK